MASLADPAAAQLGGSIALDSDYRLRGYSLTDDHPAASAQITYDHSSGLYLNLSAIAELGRDDVRFLGVIGNAGYARRLSPVLTIDAGVLRSQIRSAGRYRSYKYTEVYAGAFVGPVTARIYYSPDYRYYGQSTLYGELEGGFEPHANWRITGHVGMLVYLNSPYIHDAGSSHQDWRISATRQFGNFEIHAAFSGGGPSRYETFRVHKGTALTAGASISF